MEDASALVFLSGGGECGALLRGKDWSESPLGPPERWPQSLRSVVGLMLPSKFPMFVAWGPELRFLYNDAYAEILERKHPAAMGSRFEDIWREIWPDIEPIVAKALRGEASYHVDLPLVMNRRGFDEQTWFTFSYSPVRDETGAIAGMYCAVQETTAAVLNERAREEENERLTALFAQAPSVMAVVREPGHVFELANTAYRELVGGRPLVGKPYREALPELEGQGFFELLDQVAASGETFRARASPAELVGADGRRRQVYFDFVLQPIRNAAGHVAAIFMDGNDVTAAVQANQALREASRRKDEFLAMLAHELRNPLAPISAAADLLAVAGGDAGVVRRTSAIIARQVKHMTGLVDDLLDVSRVTRGLVRLHEEPLDIVSVVGDAVEQVRGLVQARRQHLSVHLPAQAARVLGDRTRLVQVVANLLNNAAKYTPEEGRIDVRAEVLAGGEIEIDVRDDGMGIAPELLPYVFDLFTQAERSLDRNQGGLGLGLALVRSLVELHGGSVEAHSAGLGAGSRFVVRLPGLDAPAAAALEQRHDAAPAAPAQAPLRLLVVDDNVDAADSLCLLLEALGHHAMVEHDAGGAIARAREERPQMLFLDIGLPDMDGLELARRLRAMPEVAGARLVAVTGYGQPEDQERTRQAGFDHHMTKPVKLAELRALLDAPVHAGSPHAG